MKLKRVLLQLDSLLQLPVQKPFELGDIHHCLLEGLGFLRGRVNNSRVTPTIGTNIDSCVLLHTLA